MKVCRTKFSDVLLLEPQRFEDERGWFLEGYNARTFHQVTGVNCTFVQDNVSHSKRGVLRGFHYQLQPMTQGKLVWVVCGEIFDVVLDVRRDSPTLGHWTGMHLSAHAQHRLWIPPGYAHAFMVLSDSADVFYKATAYYSAAHERSIAWDDASLDIAWPGLQPILSRKDRAAPCFEDAELVALTD